VAGNKISRVRAEIEIKKGAGKNTSSHSKKTTHPDRVRPMLLGRIQTQRIVKKRKQPNSSKGAPLKNETTSETQKRQHKGKDKRDDDVFSGEEIGGKRRKGRRDLKGEVKEDHNSRSILTGAGSVGGLVGGQGRACGWAVTALNENPGEIVHLSFSH